jgi:hypothetical protein
VCQVPICSLDLTAASGASPWSLTNAVGGGSISVTNRSTASSTVTVSTGLLMTPAASTAVWLSNTGAGFSLELADLGIKPREESFAFICRAPITTGWGANEVISAGIGADMTSANKVGADISNLSARLHWSSTTTATVGTVSTGDAIGMLWDHRRQAVTALAGAWSGTFQSTLWPLLYDAPGGVYRSIIDPAALGATPFDFATLTRAFVAAAVTSAGDSWKGLELDVVRVLYGVR